MYMNSENFRMPDSWYDPPEVEPWTCTVCGENNNEGDECDGCGASEDDAALDPYEAEQDAREEESDRRYDERRDEG